MNNMIKYVLKKIKNVWILREMIEVRDRWALLVI